MPPEINYSPLEKMHHSGLAVFKNSFRGYGILVFILVLVVCVGFAATPFFDVSLFILIGYALLLASMINVYKNKIWQEFAAANGWPVDTNEPEADALPLSVNYGHSPTFSPIIHAKLGASDCALFTYDTTTGDGKYSTTHYFTIAAVTLPKQLPHIILDSKKDHADIRVQLADKEHLRLEGDFNSYFNLLVEKGQETDVLSIITPDIMQVLINNNKAEDIEINGLNMYFILKEDKRGMDSIKNLINSVTELSDQIKENIRLATPRQSKVVDNLASAQVPA